MGAEMDVPPLQIATEGFERRLALVTSDQWDSPTPCADWNVRELVNHVTGELLWMPPLFEGQTIAEVGNRFDGDVLGPDPLATWRSAATQAVGAALAEGASERFVHLSSGETPGRDYTGQVTSDVIIHTWDLARAIGADDRMGDELVGFLMRFFVPLVEQWRAGGALGPAVDDEGDGSDQDRLIAQTGRSPRWTAA